MVWEVLLEKVRNLRTVLEVEVCEARAVVQKNVGRVARNRGVREIASLQIWQRIGRGLAMIVSQRKSDAYATG